MKNIKVSLYLLFFISLYCCEPLTRVSDLPGDVSGIVTDAESSEPIPQVNVKLTPTNDSTITAIDGSYLLKNIVTGNYNINASKQSYKKVTKNLNVDPAGTTEIDLELSLLPWPEISESFLDFGYDSISGSFTIKNIGAGKLTYSFPAAPDWVNLTPSTGDVTDEEDTITVTINRAALTDETYKERIRILSLNGEQDIWDTVNVYVNGLRDKDDNYYKVVTIGTQTWMAENLNTGTMQYLTGQAVLSDNEEIEKYCYGNDEANCNIYGGLYSWDEMMDYVSVEEGIFNQQAAGFQFNDIQGICPDGWHIPNWDEWETLFLFVGKSEIGQKLKADSPLWEGDTLIKTDEFGFGGLPGGAVEPDGSFVFGYKGSDAVIWKALIDNSTTTDGYILWLQENKIRVTAPQPWKRQYPASVRCIKDPQ